MTASRRLLAGTAALACVALAAVPAQAGKPKAKAKKQRQIEIGDNFYAPAKLTVKAGTTVVWKWPSAEVSGLTHDVTLEKGPKGVRKFVSEPFASGATFKQKLTKPGRYRIICSFHTGEMAQTIVVKR